MRPPPFDAGSCQAAIWKSRLRRFVHVARVIRDLMHSVWFVAFGVIGGGILGALVGGIGGTSFTFWVGTATGAALGGTGGGAWAKRLFFSGTDPIEPMPLDPTPGAPRWPGIEEQFNRILFRLRVLSFLLIGAFLSLCYLAVADDYHWPVPSSLPRAVLTWGSVGFMLVVALLMTLIIRCPKCGGMLWKAAQLHECPHCGIVLRD